MSFRRPTKTSDVSLNDRRQIDNGVATYLLSRLFHGLKGWSVVDSGVSGELGGPDGIVNFLRVAWSLGRHWRFGPRHDTASLGCILALGHGSQLARKGIV